MFITNFSRVPRLLLINPLLISLCNTAGGKAEGIEKGVIDFLPISAYEGNEYRLIATKKNRIGYFD